MRATTDSGSEVRFEEAGPGVLNLLTLFQILSGRTREQIETEFDGKGYGYLKRTVADQVIASMEPIQHRFHELMGDPGVWRRCSTPARSGLGRSPSRCWTGSRS